MNKKEVAEIRKRFTKEHMSIRRLCGCYVNGEKKIINTFTENFLNLPDEEFYKYLEIVKKSLSSKLGNNLLNLSFPTEAEERGGTQDVLMNILSTELADEELLKDFYNKVINVYQEAGNYLILLFFDTYDVPKKASDGATLEDSEEVYNYIICSICPVDLSKPSLGYVEDEKKIGALSRDWEVKAPETAFLFPAFNDRGSDIHNTLFYTKNSKKPHTEVMEDILGCSPVKTIDENKNTFSRIVKETAAADSKLDAEDLMLSVNQALADKAEEYNATYEGACNVAPLQIGSALLKEVIDDTSLNEEQKKKVVKDFEKTFAGTQMAAEDLIDGKLLAVSQMRMEIVSLKEQIDELTKENARLKKKAGE